jgi:4-amino-4-deoxy-L-arabinose transferase-like glycosyltransferase
MTRTKQPLQIWLTAIAIMLIALIPRLSQLNDFYTIDEAYHWQFRVEQFSKALAAGDWAATNQTGHPGVTTMWLGSLGRWLGQQAGIERQGFAGIGADYLAMLRLPLAIVNSLGAGFGFLLLSRLLRWPEAALAGFLWATSPFLVGFGRLLHLDGLLTTWMALSTLALLVSFQKKHRERYLMLAGMFAGLALLTKAPSLILLPFSGLAIAILCTLPAHGQLSLRDCQQRLRSNLPTLFRSYLIWLGTAVLVVFACWPAMWVGPLTAYGSVIREIINNGGQPHDSGNYFFGQEVAVPGPLFYPTVILLRTTPLTLLALLGGVITVAVALLTKRLHLLIGEQPADERQYPMRTVLVLITFVFVFGLLMTLQAKQLDRYLLPIWPMLEILAAIVLVGVTRILLRQREAWHTQRLHQQMLGRMANRKPAKPPYVVLILLTLSLFGSTIQPLIGLHPYYLAYYNPLVGGGPTAEHTILVGIGEGMDQVGAWLANRPDLDRGIVLSWISPTLAPFVPTISYTRDLRPAFLSQRTSYAVLYVRSVQHGESRVAEAIVRQTLPLHTVRINGIPYATIHQLARPYTTPVDVIFDQSIHLRGYSVEQKNGTLTIIPSWNIRTNYRGGTMVFAHVLNEAGQRVSQIDIPLDQGMFANWQAGQQFDEILPLALPTDPGEYRVVIGTYTPEGTRLPITQGTALPEQIAGPHALELLRFRVGE